MKLLVYSHDTFGLGNIRRMLAICKHLHETVQDISILIITGSPMLHSFRVAHGIDYIKLPCLKRRLSGDLGVRFLDLESDEIIRLRSRLIQTSVQSFRPDAVLVDKKPTGLAGELEPALRLIRSGFPSAKVLLVLRDILDEPEATIEQWQKAGCDEAVRWYYDSVLVLGNAHIFDAGAEYRFSPDLRAKLVYCGYVRRDKSHKTREAARRELNLTDSEKLVLVTAGGGEDGYHLLHSYLSGLAIEPPPSNVTSLIVTGPELAPAQRRTLEVLAAPLPAVRLIEFTDDLMGFMDAADVVVSMGGYNTVCELLTLNKRAVIVPRTEPVAEQRIRAERMAALSLFRMILPTALAPSALMRAVRDELNASAPPAQDLVALDALPRISRLLVSLAPGARLNHGPESAATPQPVA